VLPILALYVVAAEEQGVPPEKLAGTIQNDISKSSWSATPHLSAAAVDADHLGHLRLHQRQHAEVQLDLDLRLPHPEAGATADLELAYTLADGVEYLKAGRDAGLDVDKFAPRFVLLLGHRHELLHGGRQGSRRPAAVE